LCRDSVARDYDAATTDALYELIVACDAQLLMEHEDNDRVKSRRVVCWFANAALTRRGIAPRSRECLGSIPIRSKRLLHDIRKQDAPYIDLQWLAFKYPERIPRRWSGIKTLLATAPGLKAKSGDKDPTFDYINRDDALDHAFCDADLLINRRVSIARRCIALNLPTAAQAEMRWLCSSKVRKLVRDLKAKESDLRDAMRRQGIKQLKPEHIDARVQTFRAWKLAGGGTNWQAAADTLAAMTGIRKSRQAIKEMITRMGEQKLIRRRKGKKRTLEPILPK
jgi:hypothetical protein